MFSEKRDRFSIALQSDLLLEIKTLRDKKTPERAVFFLTSFLIVQPIYSKMYHQEFKKPSILGDTLI